MPGMGFRLGRSMGMEGSTGNLRDYPIASGYTTALFRGDLCTLNGGNVQVTDGGAGDKVLGIFWGCKYVGPDGSVTFSPYWSGVAGNSEAMAQVAILPAGATALVKGADGATYAAADIGTRKAANVSVAGDPQSGMSRQALGAPGATVATAALIVLGRVDLGDGSDWFEVAVAADNAIINTGA